MKTGKRIFIQTYNSPCGDLLLGSFGDRLCLCNWTKEKHPGAVDRRLHALLSASYTEAPSDITREAASQLDEYFRRERRAFDIPLLFAGTEFQNKVWDLLLQLPYGPTVTSARLALSL